MPLVLLERTNASKGILFVEYGAESHSQFRFIFHNVTKRLGYVHSLAVNALLIGH